MEIDVPPSLSPFPDEPFTVRHTTVQSSNARNVCHCYNMYKVTAPDYCEEQTLVVGSEGSAPPRC